MKYIFILLMLVSVTVSAFELASPDQSLNIEIQMDKEYSGYAAPTYTLHKGNTLLMPPSRLGFTLDNSQKSTNPVKIISKQETRQNNSWQPVYGERAEIPDVYNELTLNVQEKDTNLEYQIIFRAYNEGIAFCYHFPEQPGLETLHIEKELTEFSFNNNHTIWAAYKAQAEYEKTTINEIKPGCERPLVIEQDETTYLAIAEARLVDYARMKLMPQGEKPNTLLSDLAGPVTLALPCSTPWRVVMVGDSPGELLEKNYLILNLNDPCEIKDTSWIKPGKVIRETTLTTRGGLACVDFAVKHNLQYVEFDAGWYGHEYDEKSDATTITVDPKRSPGPLDLHKVIKYAKERNIGIIVYVNRRALEKQLDEILPLYVQWGISGVKYGFVNVGTQEWTTWLHMAVRKAAQYKLMVDVHDEYRPTGYTRTYPNFMTQEGIRGDEVRQPNELTLTTLFTRMIAGAGDNTLCYFNPRVPKYNSHAYQLAKAVCFYSPWQFLYWYDRPKASSDQIDESEPMNGVIGDEPELEFYDAIPTVWDETQVIDGKIGEYAIIARQSGKTWFVGCMNSGKEREFNVPLTFLSPNTKWSATVYSNNTSIKTRTQVKIENIKVSSKDVITKSISAQGGFAIRLESL